jgi:hypothetical protein
MWPEVDPVSCNSQTTESTCKWHANHTEVHSNRLLLFKCDSNPQEWTDGRLTDRCRSLVGFRRGKSSVPSEV